MTSHLVQLGGYRAGIPLYWTLFLLIPKLKCLNPFKKAIYFLLLENVAISPKKTISNDFHDICFGL